MAKKKKQKTVIQFRKKPSFAAALFVVILVYVIRIVVIFADKSSVQTYETQLGSLTNNATFTTCAIRDETIYYTEFAGDVNYYQREGTRVMNGDTVYTVDETGRVAEILSNYSNGLDNNMTDEELSEIKNTLITFKSSYKEIEFNTVYDLKADLNAAVLQSINDSISANLDSIVESTGSKNLFQTVRATSPGVVVYSIDGYENINVSNISSVDFDKNNYTKKNLKSEELVAKGDPAYKMINSEEWYLFFPLSDADISKYELAEKKSLQIKFNKDGITEVFPFKLVATDKGTYGMLTLQKYMIRYATERFIDIEIVSSGTNGIKIPVSAITEKEFYKIPKEYVNNTDGNISDYTALVEEYNSSGELKVINKKLDVYKATDDFIYVNTDAFSTGANLLKEDSQSRYVIGPTERLKGVYCVNTGYAIFKLVDIIDENNEYYIVKRSITHGVSIYDRILLKAEKYEEGQMIY